MLSESQKDMFPLFEMTSPDRYQNLKKTEHERQYHDAQIENAPQKNSSRVQ